MKKQNVNTMTAEEWLQRQKAEIWSPDYVPPTLRRRKHWKAILAELPTVVAEGDSWFDYLPGKDVLDNLRGTHGYKIYKFADGGDTLENMVYGTENHAKLSSETSWVSRSAGGCPKVPAKSRFVVGGR